MRTTLSTPIKMSGVFALICMGAITLRYAFDQSQGYYGYADDMLWLTIMRVGMMLSATGAGFACGWILSPQAEGLRRKMMMAIVAAVILIAILNHGSLGWSTATLLSLVGFLTALGYWLGRGIKAFVKLPSTFGTSKWATAAYLLEHKLLGTHGLLLGLYFDGEVWQRISYSGDRHLITVAPNRSWKGVSHIIPNLLTYEGSVMVIDPKGENALITALARQKMGQKVILIDPWGIAAPKIGIEAARFNPLDWLQPGDVDMAENAMILTDALVRPATQKTDPFFREEAKAFVQGLLMHVAVAEEFDGRRNLGTVRDLMLLSGPDMMALFESMAGSPHSLVASTGARCLQKDEKLLSNVLASAQAETHILDSQRLRECLSASDFRFEDLKSTAMSIFIIIPADRLQTFSPFLRLTVQQAITVTARNIEDKPENPVLFILDEMAALGHLPIVHQAYGLMAGFGMQLWGIVQDLNQLQNIYGDAYETFIANSGAVCYFGSPDKRSAEYFSALCGVTTVWNFSTALATAFSSTFGQNGNGGSKSASETDTRAAAQRKLAYPDELMRMKIDQQLILIANTDPIMAKKLRWFDDPELKDKGVNLHG